MVFLELDYCRGGDLEMRLGRGCFAPAELHLLVQQLCRAVRFVHSRRQIHCDIKPANVLLDQGQWSRAAAAKAAAAPAAEKAAAREGRRAQAGAWARALELEGRWAGDSSLPSPEPPAAEARAGTAAGDGGGGGDESDRAAQLASSWRGLPNGVRLADFGVAKLLQSRRYSTNHAAGTEAFMAPELQQEPVRVQCVFSACSVRISAAHGV